MDRFRMLPSYHYEDNTDGSLLKSVGKPLRDYKIEGNCFQDGVPSPENPIEVQCCGEKTKNLFDKNLSNLSAIQTETVLTYYGAVFFQNSATLAMLKPNTTYTVSFECECIDVPTNATFYAGRIGFLLHSGISGYSGISLYEDNKELAEGEKFFYSKTFTTPSTLHDVEANYRLVLYTNIYKDADGKTIYASIIYRNIQFELGDTATEYEPYGRYKIPITVGGKNMFDFDSVTEMRKSNGTVSTLWEKDGDELIVDRGKNDGGIYFPCNVTRLKAGTYTLSFSVYIPNRRTAVYMGYQVNTGSSMVVKKISVGKADTWVNIQASFKVAADTDIVGIVLQGEGEASNYSTLGIRFKNIQLEKSNSATKYESYFEPKTYNIYLDEPLRKVGDYADYIDFKSGKVVKNVMPLEFDDSITIKSYTYGNDMDNTYHFQFMVGVNAPQSVARTEMFCNILPAGDLGMNSVSTDSFFSSRYTAARYPFYAQIEKALIDGYEYDTIEEKLRAFLNEKGAIVYCCRAESLESDITLPKILTEKRTNIITIGTTLQPSTVNYQYYKGGK